jgi:cell cycle checkpoint protein
LPPSVHVFIGLTRRSITATAYVFKEIFDEYKYHPDINPPEPEPFLNDPDSSQHEEETYHVALEIPLNTLVECLNIFGTAGVSASSAFQKHKQWRRADDRSDHDRDDDHVDDDAPSRNRRGAGGAGGGRIDQYFSSSEKRTGMRLTYAGAGCPLPLIM